MRLKKTLKLISLYIVLFLAGTVMYILSMKTCVFEGIPVFFYRGLAAILVWGIIVSAVMAVIKIFKKIKYIDVRDILLLFFVFVCVNVVVFTHLPVTAERSVSVFMLGIMAEDEHEYSKDGIEEIFIDRYVGELGAFDKRLDEQVYSGTIRKTDSGKYIITDAGKRIISIYEKVISWYGLDDSLIHSADSQ